MCTKMFAQPVAEERHGKSIGNLSKIAKDDDGNVSKTNYTRQKAHVNM